MKSINSNLTSDCVVRDLPPARPEGHTPGPWTVQITGMRGSFHIPQAQQHEAEAAHTDGIDGGTVSHANAALIAAAPELLAAAQCAQNILFLLQDEVKALGLRAQNVPDKLRAAIDNATGAAE